MIINLHFRNKLCCDESPTQPILLWNLTVKEWARFYDHRLQVLTVRHLNKKIRKNNKKIYIYIKKKKNRLTICSKHIQAAVSL